MKILFVSRSYYPYLIGGLEIFAKDYYENIKTKADVDLFAGKSPYRLSIRFIIKLVVYLIRFSSKYDIVHFRDAVHAPFIPIVKIFSKSRVTVTVHGLDIIYPNLLYQWMIPKFLRKSDKIFCVSQNTMNECQKRNINARKMTVIPNGFDFNGIPNSSGCSKLKMAQKYNKTLDGKKILFTVGRLIKRKGHSWFIQNVMPLLPENYIFIIGGNGPEYNNLENTIMKLNLEDRVHLLGLIPEDDKNCFFQISDLFIMPNIKVENDIEGFGIAIIEAGSYGLPVIASDIEGIREAVIDGKTGCLVHEKSVGEFCEAIKQDYIGNENISQIIREVFAWEIIADRYIEQFKLLLQ